MKTKLKSGVVALSVGPLMLAGCANLPSDRALFGGGGYINEGDACRAERVVLTEYESRFAASIVTGAVTGAATTALTQLITTGEVSGRAVAAGALAGALGGYLGELYRQNQRDTLGVMRQVNQDLEQENQSIDGATAAFEALMACRRTEAEAIRARLTNGLITQTEAETEMEGVRVRVKEDIERAQDIQDDLLDRSESYESVYVNLDEAGAEAAGDLPTRIWRSTGNVNVRADATTSSARVGGVTAGEIVTVTAVRGEWYRIFTEDGLEGFIFASLLEPADTAQKADVQGEKVDRSQLEDPDMLQVSSDQQSQQELGELREKTYTNRLKRAQFVNQTQVASNEVDAEGGAFAIGFLNNEDLRFAKL